MILTHGECERSSIVLGDFAEVVVVEEKKRVPRDCEKFSSSWAEAKVKRVMEIG